MRWFDDGRLQGARGRPSRSRAPARPQRRAVRGFSLIEILVVLAIIGLLSWSLLSIVGPSRSSEFVRATNGVASTIRYGYDRARTTGTYFRLHIDIDNGTFTLQQADERMFLPATDRDGKRVKYDADKEKERADRDERAASAYFGSLASKILAKSASQTGMTTQSSPAPNGGVVDPYAVIPQTVPRQRPPVFGAFDDENQLGDIGAPIVLPERVKIVSVRTEADFEPITQGAADLYFFPRGQTQLAHIQIQDTKGGEYYTIIVQPLTGKVLVKPEQVELVLPDDVLSATDALGRKQQRRTF